MLLNANKLIFLSFSDVWYSCLAGICVYSFARTDYVFNTFHFSILLGPL